MDPRALSAGADVDALDRLGRAVPRDRAASRRWPSGRRASSIPGPEVRTDAELRDYVRRVTGSYHHQVGTCRMGADDDAVVDPELRVHGVEGLRVADASVMPSVTTGNTNAPSMMIGARAAAMMLAA